MRIAKFLAVFMIVTGLVYLLVVGLNFNVFKTVFTNQEALAEGSEWVEKTFSLAGMTDFVAAHPQLVSIVMLPADTASSHRLHFEENTPRAMGATAHFFLLVAYAQAVESGIIDPDQPVNLDDLDRFAVPGHEPNRHRESVRLLNRLGLVENNLAPVDAIVSLMVTRNHQPSADYVYHLLGKPFIHEVTGNIMGEQAEVPITWSSFYTAATIVMPAHDEPVSQEDRIRFQQQASIVFDQLDTGAMRISEMLPEGRKRGVDYTFFEEKSIYRLLPHVVPVDLAAAMLTILTEDDFPGRERILNHMRWPMENTDILRDFSDVGAIYDSRIALSNGISFGTSAYTGETFASVTFFDQLPIGFWMHMSSNLINQDFQLRLKFDPAMFEKTSKTLLTSTEMN
ncbi:MAG: hypothetical protein LAT52_01150 [Balneolales bacterium]|nr:hypothetical protein [Balneolales bacterium]